MEYQRPTVMIFLEEVMKFFTVTLLFAHDGTCRCTASGSRVTH